MAEDQMRVGVLGDRESVLCFMSLGYTVREVSDGAAAAQMLTEMAESGAYGIIFVTEALVPALTEQMDRYKDVPLPAIIIIPAAGGEGSGYGMRALHRAVERAVGADILDKT